MSHRHKDIGEMLSEVVAQTVCEVTTTHRLADGVVVMEVGAGGGTTREFLWCEVIVPVIPMMKTTRSRGVVIHHAKTHTTGPACGDFLEIGVCVVPLSSLFFHTFISKTVIDAGAIAVIFRTVIWNTVIIPIRMFCRFQ